MDVTLYVGNLAKTTSENELRNLFSQVGEVTNLSIMKDRISGESRQYGFLTMSAQSQADRAVSRFDNYLLGQHKLKVILTRPRVNSGAPGSWFKP
jgi:RNA recognition motif-containing protein